MDAFFRVILAQTLSLMLAVTAAATVEPVIVYRSPSGAYQLYTTAAGDIVTLDGTEKMDNAVVGDMDGNGLEDELVYTDDLKGGLGCYKIPADGLWHAENDRFIPNAHSDAIPLTVIRTGKIGVPGAVVYRSAAGRQAYSIRVDGTSRTAVGRMDKCYAVDVRMRGFKGDLVWWRYGFGMYWREGLCGTNRRAPHSDWIPLGGGKILSSSTSKNIAFIARRSLWPGVYVCDRYFRFTRIDGTSDCSWCANRGSIFLGDADEDGLAELVYVESWAAPMRWYSVPSRGGPWTYHRMVTASSVRCGWNLVGIASVDMSAQPPPPPPNVPTAYSAWIRSSLEKPYKTDPAKQLQTTTIKAARHEHEAFQIVLRGGDSQVSSVALSAKDLVSPAGAIPASNVSFFVTGYVPLQDFGKDYPDPLPPYREPFNLATGQTQPIWVDVYVPKSAAAGDYTGAVVIEDASGAKAEIPFTLHVYGFTLPDEWKCTTSFALRDEEISQQHQQTHHSDAHIQTIKNYYEFMLTRGVSAYNLPFGVDVMSSTGAQYLSDPRMSSFILPYSSDANWMKQTVAKYESLSVLDKAYYYTYDEPYTVDLFEEVKETCTYLHNIDPRLRTMVAFSDFPIKSTEPDWAAGKSYAVGTIVGHQAQGYYERDYLFKCKVAHTSKAGTNEPWKGTNWQQYWSRVTHVDYLKGYIDIWCVGADGYHLMPNEIAARRAAGDTVWTYNWFGVARNGEITPAIAPRLQSWLTYRNDAQGMLWWCANWWQGCPNPWTNLKNTPTTYAEGLAFYPGYQIGIDGGVSSIRFEMIRDSLEDYQYLWFLEQKIGRAGVLNHVNRLVTSYTSYTQDNDLFATVRDDIARAIE